jgi:hypothetical protein
VNWTHLAPEVTHLAQEVTGDDNEHPGCIKSRKFLNQLGNCQLFEKNSVPWSYCIVT